MLTGLESAAAGMAAQQQRIDAVANDLANTNTTGYKHVRVAFRDLVYQDVPTAALPNVRTGSGVAATQAGRSFQQGALQSTGRNLDVAIQGEGFFRVRLADGRQALTRDGNLQVDGAGHLATPFGGVVQPAIRVPAGVSSEQLSIGADGSVRAGNRTLGRLEVVSVRSPQELMSAGDNAFIATPQSGAPRAVSSRTPLVT